MALGRLNNAISEDQYHKAKREVAFFDAAIKSLLTTKGTETEKQRNNLILQTIIRVCGAKAATDFVKSKLKEIDIEEIKNKLIDIIKE